MHKTPEIFKHPIKTLRQLFQIAQFCHKIIPLYSVKYWPVFLHAVRLCHEERFLPDEAFRLGLFNPNLSCSELSKYASRKKLTKAQESVNPVSWAPLLKDKGIFYRHCMALGVPIPKLYAIFFRKTAGWSYNNLVLATGNDWQRFFDVQLPSEFVIKPTRGAYGDGVNVFFRTSKGFTDAFKNLYTSQQLYDAIVSHPKYDSFVVQQRLKSHPELIRLSDTQFLQTVRFVTFVDSDNQCNILLAHLKPIIGENVIDNWQQGLTGNVEAIVSLDDGILKPANQITSNGSGIKTILIHPKTGVCFDGFQLPLWPQACKLVKETAPKFLPIRTIAWDVALTPDGPYIVEGNIWWDPCNQQMCMDMILDALSCHSQESKVSADRRPAENSPSKS
jgi:hypothetical protein